MRKTKMDAKEIWKQVEENVVPKTRIGLNERVVYFYLLRQTRLEGRKRLKFSMTTLGKWLLIANETVRRALRRLAAKGVIRILERSKAGHVVEVLLPSEVRNCPVEEEICVGRDLEELDFAGSWKLRRAIHRREESHCFYCRRSVRPRMRELDHVVPRAAQGRNSYRNLVSCCRECNSRKGDRPVEDFLRELFRERRLNVLELEERMRAVKDLGEGKLKPSFEGELMPSGRIVLRRKFGAPALGPSQDS